MYTNVADMSAAARLAAICVQEIGRKGSGGPDYISLATPHSTSI
jgi:hypothetical protein